MMVTEMGHTLLSDTQLQAMRSAFRIADVDADRVLDQTEFLEAASELGMRHEISDNELKGVFDVSAALSPRADTIKYSQFVKAMAPLYLAHLCPHAKHKGEEEGEKQVEGIINSRTDLGGAHPKDSAAAARVAARAAIAKSLQPPAIKVVRERVVDSKESVERVVRLESKVASLERMLTKEQAIAAKAVTAASAAAAAADNEATRNHVRDYVWRHDDSREFKGDLVDSIGDVARQARVACKQSALSMRIAASTDANALAALSDEMRQDLREDAREALHGTEISESPGAVQKLLSASRDVVAKERQALNKVLASVAHFDPPDCVEPKRTYTVKADTDAWHGIQHALVDALNKVLHSEAYTMFAHCDILERSSAHRLAGTT
jgi:cell division septum initiation protein DivIVA